MTTERVSRNPQVYSNKDLDLLDSKKLVKLWRSIPRTSPLPEPEFDQLQLAKNYTYFFEHFLGY